MSDKLISKIPDGPLEQKWSKRKSEIHLVSPKLDDARQEALKTAFGIYVPKK